MRATTFLAAIDSFQEAGDAPQQDEEKCAQYKHPITTSRPIALLTQQTYSTRRAVENTTSVALHSRLVTRNAAASTKAVSASNVEVITESRPGDPMHDSAENRPTSLAAWIGLASCIADTSRRVDESGKCKETEQLVVFYRLGREHRL